MLLMTASPCDLITKNNSKNSSGPYAIIQLEVN